MDGNRYINPYSDYGFKYLFGSKPNKELTLSFVNALLQGLEVKRKWEIFLDKGKLIKIV